MTRSLRMYVGAMLILATFTASAHCPPHRSIEVKRQFVTKHPCPSTGSHKWGNCTGWVADHILPICAGGKDTVKNLQWQTIADAKAKDILERAQCRKK